MLLKALDLLTGEALIVWHCLQHQTPLAVVACCGMQMDSYLVAHRCATRQLFLLHLQGLAALSNALCI